MNYLALQITSISTKRGSALAEELGGGTPYASLFAKTLTRVLFAYAPTYAATCPTRISNVKARPLSESSPSYRVQYHFNLRVNFAREGNYVPELFLGLGVGVGSPVAIADIDIEMR